MSQMEQMLTGNYGLNNFAVDKSDALNEICMYASSGFQGNFLGLL